MAIIYVDVDSVLNNLTDEWYRRYNHDYNDDLTEKRVTSWNLQHFVKPECGDAIYKYLHDPSLYMFLRPTRDSQYVTAKLRNKHILYAVSACVVGSLDAKAAWVNQYFSIPFIACKDKWLLKGDVLIDDGEHNAEKFEGRFLLYDQPWNRSNTTLERVMNWNDILKKLYYVG